MNLFKRKRKLGNGDDHINLIAKNSPTSVLAEQFRTVQTNISFANVHNYLRSFMVTSDRPSQGKSTVSSNLAVTFAQQGQKVILLDGDMRRPIAHKTFNLNNNDKGLSTCLSGMSSVKDSIQYTDINNLLVMPSGPMPPNPSELLNGNNFDNILEQLYGYCDLVILDTPPVNSVSDTSVLANKVDGTVMIIPQSITDKYSIRMAVNQLKKVHANILGAIMNNVTDQNIDDYYYYK